MIQDISMWMYINEIDYDMVDMVDIQYYKLKYNMFLFNKNIDF